MVRFLHWFPFKATHKRVPSKETHPHTGSLLYNSKERLQELPWPLSRPCHTTVRGSHVLPPGPQFNENMSQVAAYLPCSNQSDGMPSNPDSETGQAPAHGEEQPDPECDKLRPRAR